MEFEEPLTLSLEPCSFCGRKFAPDSLHRHETICRKTSQKRPVFNSSKQRSVEGSGIKPQRSSNTLKPSNSSRAAKSSTKSNWRAKHEEFIKTVQAARAVTVAIKQGKELPPPPPPTINPDYVQCPHCMRRFNKTAAERHIAFCAEQSKRLSNKKTVVHGTTKQAAAARASVRLQYRPPMPRKKEVSKPSVQTTAVSNQPSFSTTGSTPNSNFTAAQKLKKPKPEWDSAFDRPDDRNDYSKTGLRPSSGSTYKPSNYKPSSKATRQPAKPVVRKVAGKKTTVLSEQSKHHNNAEPYNFSSNNSVKNTVNSGVIGGRSRVAKLTTNSQPDFYDWLQPDELHARSGAKQQTSKFCHECGARFPVSNAKFCCKCGLKRIVIR